MRFRLLRLAITPLLFFALAGCSAEPAAIENEEVQNSEVQPENSGLDAESACDEALRAVDQLTALNDLLVADARAAFDDGADSANNAIKKYGTEIERVGQTLLSLQVAEPDLAESIRRFANAQIAFANQINEGLFNSGKVDELTDEAVFATVELRGACGR